MRSFSLPLPTLFAGFVAVLVGYASSAAIIWQAAAAAGATPGQIAGWMTALGLAMGISTLALIAAASGDVASAAVPLAFVTPEWVAPQFTPALLLSVGLPFFLVTMASQNAPGFATLQASGYTVPVSALIVVCGGLALLLAPFGVYSICIAAITAAICQSPEAHPDPNQRWLAAIAAGGFYLLAGLFGGSITALMSALPPAWIQMLAGLALLGTIGGSLFQAVHQASERDAAVLTFLVTASGVTLAGIGSAFWGVVLGGVSYGVLSALRRP
ncbi:benzoate/H(+) symporter BenE family transporter [Klebsiella pneumoniae]|uniref:benzoate/H(+) symporter BenE family transporter n=1 Tax=Klebsiella pneumoniae TaxID=573 RepID=UPI0027DFEEB7|nr:benzoate/H(+) symporter BenE family transporter [Klebsiella pneumoniae]MDQ6313506.1 benzoate/H(+) symporter BenE family transporter [Klebsiella pneumoniae]HDO6929013.1 benzoate/H(+) symporter BenE family transporter [Klebsiella pneumoniae]